MLFAIRLGLFYVCHDINVTFWVMTSPSIYSIPLFQQAGSWATYSDRFPQLNCTCAQARLLIFLHWCTKLGETHMASPKLSAIGTERGPCADENCNHIDCNIIRRMAARKCVYCCNAIGYEIDFYALWEHRYAHAECHKHAVRAGTLKKIFGTPKSRPHYSMNQIVPAQSDT